MSDWIELNPENLGVTWDGDASRSGTKLVFGLAPQEVPKKLRGHIGEHGSLIVQFEYPTTADEGRREVGEEKAVKLIVGQRTGRVYEIVCNRDFIRDMQTQIRDSVERLIKERSLGRLRKHYEVAAEAVQDNALALEASL